MAGLKLSGLDLDLDAFAQAAGRVDPRISVTRDAIARMKRSRRVIHDIVARGVPVYGVTTGLGARVMESLSHDELAAFSLQTIRGRAHAVGPPLPARIVRAAMVARLNTLLGGASGASVDAARFLQACLNRNLIPVVGETASVGASDLCWGATMALALIGEGRMVGADGKPEASRKMLEVAGLSPFEPGPRDGLALANHSSFTAAISGLAVAGASRLVETTKLATVMSMETFRANLSVLDEAVLAYRPQPGQAAAAAGLQQLLAGSALHEPGAARRLQDPISIRNAVQVLGSVIATLAFAEDACRAELNGAGDNPVILPDTGTVISSGNYFTPHLTVAIGALAQALAQQAVLQLARLSKLMSARFTDLPLFLATPGASSNGFAPVMKVAEALVAEIRHLSQPVDIWPSVNADGAEDGLTNAPLAARNLERLVDKAAMLCAIELLVSAQGIELRQVGHAVSEPVAKALADIREASAPLTQDRPLGDDIMRVAVLVRNGII